MEQAQVRVDTANRRVQTSAQAVEAAQKKLNDAIKKYGEGSNEAKAAADKLKSAIDGHQIAVDRAQLQQTKFNETLASLATEIAPNVIGVFGSIVGAISSFTTKGEGGVTLAGKLKASFSDLVSGGGALESLFSKLGLSASGFGGALGAVAAAAAVVGVAVVGAYGDFLVLSDSIETAKRTSTESSSQMITEWGEFGKRLQAIDFSTPQAAIETIAKHVADFSGIMSNTWIVMSNLQDQTKKNTTEWNLFGIKLGETQGNLVGLGTAIASFVSDKLGALRTALVNLPSQIGDLGAQLWAKITTGWQDLNAWINTNIVKPIQNFPSQIGALGAQIWSRIVQGWTDLTKWVDDNITKPLTGFLDRLTGKGADIWTRLSNGWKEITDWVSTHIVKPLEDFPTNLAKKGSEIWTKLSEGWTDLTKWVTDHITDPLSKFPSQLKALGSQIWDKLVAGWKGIEDWIKTNIVTPISNLPQTIPALGAQIYQKIIAGWGDFSKFLQDKVVTPLRNALTGGGAGADSGIAALTKLEQSLKTATAATGGFTAAQVLAKEQLAATHKVTDDLVKKNNEMAGTITGMNQLLTTQAGQQKLVTEGTQQQVNALQQAQAALISSTAALQQYNQQLTTGVPQQTAFQQGIVDFGRAVDDVITKTANLVGQFTAFTSAAGNGKDMLAQFNQGFAQGLNDVQKWAEGIANARGSIEGTRAGLEILANLWGVELPKSITLSNDQLKTWIGIIVGAPAELDKLDKAASESFGIVVKEFDKLRDATNQKDMFKTMNDNLQEQIQKFGAQLPQLTQKIAQEVSSMTDTLNKGINTMGADLTAAKLTVGPINTQSIADAKQAMEGMVSTLNNQFSGALTDLAPKFQPLINDIAEFGRRQTDVQGVEKAMGLFKLAVDAATNPTSQTAQAMLTAGANAAGMTVKLDPATGALRLVATNSKDASSNVDTFGKSSESATKGVDGLGNSMTTLTANTGFAASALEALKTQWIDPLTNTTLTIKVTSDTGSAASALSALKTQFVDPMTNTTLKITVTADTGAAASALSTLKTTWVDPLTNAQKIIQVTANTGPAASALGALQNTVTALTGAQHIIQITANTGPAASAIGALQNTISAMTTNQHIVQITANTGPAASAIGALQNTISALTQAQHIVQVTANTGPATSAIQQLQNLINQVKAPFTITPQANTGPATSALQQLLNIENQIKQPITITITANTGPAASAINALQQQLNALRAAGGAAGVPIQTARTGGEFAIVPGGFKRTKRGDQLHAAQGGSFIVTKETRLANLTVGEGNQPELLTFSRGKGGKGIGMLMVTPIKVPKSRRLHAQLGGSFSTPNFEDPNAILGMSGGFMPQTGLPQSYNIPAPGASTVGAGQVGPGYLEAGPGVVQQGMPSEVGAGTILVAKAGAGQSGPPAPGNLISGGVEGLTAAMNAAGGGGTTTTPAATTAANTQQINKAVNQIADNTSNIPQTSPYQIAHITGEAVASELGPGFSHSQQDMSELLALVRKLIMKIFSKDMNTNLIVDGQKIASSISKYLGSNAYGGM